MFRAAILAVLAVALSSSPAFAEQLGSIYPMAIAAIENTQVMAVAAATSTSLVIPEETLSATSPARPVAFARPIAPAALSNSARPAPWWATTLAVAGPLADGLSTYYGIKQSGPNARVAEGNGFYHHLFGANVKPSEILAFKVAQAALMGYGVHAVGRQSRERAIGSALIQGAVHAVVSVLNMKNAAKARRLNAAGPR